MDKKIKLRNTKDVNVNSKVLQTLVSTLTNADMVVTLQLLQYLNKDNVIIYKHKPASTQDLSEIIGKNYDTARKIFKKLKQQNIIKKVKLTISDYSMYNSVFVFNPWICSSGNNIYLEILNIFKDSEWKSLMEGKVDGRNSFEYILWEENIKERDNCKCVICGDDLDIEVHHISPYAIDYDNRLNVKNGLCLCRRHHNTKVMGSFHQKYGTQNNTPEQLQEYIDNKRSELGLPRITIEEIINK